MHDPVPMRARKLALLAPLLVTPLLVASLLMTACGSSSAPPASEPSGTSAIAFPPGAAITMAPTITVRGTADDPGTVTSILVGGAAATSADGFATWTAVVPLTEGDNLLEVLVDRGGGAVKEAEVGVRREGPVPWEYGDGVLDASADVIYVLNRRSGDLIAIDRTTGARRLVVGTVFLGTQYARLGIDETSGLVYVSYIGPSDYHLDVVNPATGAVTNLARTGDGKGPDISGGSRFRPVAIDPVAGLALVNDSGAGSGIENRLIGIDLATGVRTTLSEQMQAAGTEDFTDVAAAPGTGTAIVADTNAFYSIALATGAITTLAVPGARAFAADPTGQRAFRESDGDVYEVDLQTGTSTMVSAKPSEPYAVRFVREDRLWFDAAAGTLEALVHENWVVEVDPTSGQRTERFGVASTGPKTYPHDLTTDKAGRLYVTDDSQHEVVRVDLASGQRGTLSGQDVGSGPALEAPHGIVLAKTGNHAYVVNADITPTNAVYRLDLDTGARTLVSDATLGSGIDICYGIDMDCAADGTLYIVDEDDSQIVAVDPFTGNRRRVAGDGVGLGPELQDVHGGAYDDTTDTFYVCESETVLAVDPVSGDRRVVFDGNAYAPPRTLNPGDVSVSEDGTVLYVTDELDGTVHRVDAVTGAATVIVDPATTSGFPFARPFLTSETMPGGVLFVADIYYDGVFAVDVTTGESVLVVR